MMGSDEMLARYEALVRQQLCKCVVGATSFAYNNCPLHAGFPVGASPAEILRDQRGYVPSAPGTGANQNDVAL